MSSGSDRSSFSFFTSSESKPTFAASPAACSIFPRSSTHSASSATGVIAALAFASTTFRPRSYSSCWAGVHLTPAAAAVSARSTAAASCS